MYDLPAIIDYIFNTTKHERIFYVGHSEGTTQFFVMASEKPEYNSKIILMIALAPAAYTANMRGPITQLAKLTYFGVVSHRSNVLRLIEFLMTIAHVLQWVGETFGYPEFGSRSDWGKFASNLFCQSAAPTQFICSNIMFLMAGYSQAELDIVR